jgi:hypothetical protein
LQDHPMLKALQRPYSWQHPLVLQSQILIIFYEVV